MFFFFNPPLRLYQEGLRKVILHGNRISKIFPAGYQSFEKNVNQIEILKTEILWNILHTVEHFIKLVVGEKHSELDCQLS